MCGLTGFLTNNPTLLSKAGVILSAMTDSISHRGPNDSGIWIDVDGGIALGHRRLSIIDLSTAGHQPMISTSGRYVIAFNGEIYNHLELRLDLDRCNKSGGWRGHSDTESLLEGFEIWGVESTLKKTVGMFAISLWDRQENTLILARDRMGEKPLYYGFQRNTFLFSSELKALKLHPDFLGEIDRDALCLYLRYCYIPAPHSIYKGIHKLLPGTFLKVKLGKEFCSQALTPISYWSLEESCSYAIENPFEGTDKEAIETLDSQLKNAIELQVLADVPVGAFLSGGVDSSAIASIMQANSMKKINTYSIGFQEAGYNEAEYAKSVAKYLGTDHAELYISSEDALKVIPLLCKIYDEPFADSSQIPTYLVSQMARKSVTVALSGDGGDELFGGYNRYLLADSWRKIEFLPFAARKSMGHLIASVSPSAWNALFAKIGKLRPVQGDMGRKLEKLAKHLVHVNDINQLYVSLVSTIENPESIVLGASAHRFNLLEDYKSLSFQDAKERMMFLDAKTYLPDDILVKVDRASMSNSLETRVPFLDHRVIELAWRLPIEMKVRQGQSKWILRQVLYQYVPKNLIERPKVGFSIPLGEWLRGPLRGWAEELLSENRLIKEGFFDHATVSKIWYSHLQGKENHESLLWCLLMFQAWLEGSA